MSPISPRAAGEVGRLLASAEMLINGISPSRPEDDHGYDIVSVYGSKLCRVQVKTVYMQKPRPLSMSETFPVRRRRVCRRQRQDCRNSTYAEGELDAFVFVSLVTKSFWVVPTHEIDLNSHKLSLRTDSPWHNAWHVLK
jgi:hypothetical protein